MNWLSFTQQGTGSLADFSAGTRDQRRVRVLILIALLFMPGSGRVCFQPENRGNAWLFQLLTALVVIIPGRRPHEWRHYRSMILLQRFPVVYSRTVDVGTTCCPAGFGGLPWRQRLHNFTLPSYYLPGAALPGNGPVRLAQLVQHRTGFEP